MCQLMKKKRWPTHSLCAKWAKAKSKRPIPIGDAKQVKHPSIGECFSTLNLHKHLEMPICLKFKSSTEMSSVQMTWFVNLNLIWDYSLMTVAELRDHLILTRNTSKLISKIIMVRVTTQKPISTRMVMRLKSNALRSNGMTKNRSIWFAEKIFREMILGINLWK